MTNLQSAILTLELTSSEFKIFIPVERKLIFQFYWKLQALIENHIFLFCYSNAGYKQSEKDISYS